mmetsp:Transcript_112889/g.282635  ORF Transcript_112889/g.282635 Transcript_112889/m.282635 type:complete len:287 (+) Transcript_112889:502-1362(+)
MRARCVCSGESATARRGVTMQVADGVLWPAPQVFEALCGVDRALKLEILEGRILAALGHCAEMHGAIADARLHCRQGARCTTFADLIPGHLTRRPVHARLWGEAACAVNGGLRCADMFSRPRRHRHLRHTPRTTGRRFDELDFGEEPDDARLHVWELRLITGMIRNAVVVCKFCVTLPKALPRALFRGKQQLIEIAVRCCRELARSRLCVLNGQAAATGGGRQGSLAAAVRGRRHMQEGILKLDLVAQPPDGVLNLSVLAGDRPVNNSGLSCHPEHNPSKPADLSA